jgi:hypothetical protein
MRMIFGEEYRSWISSTSPLSCYLISFRSKYLSTLFPNTLNVRDKVSHPDKMTGKIAVLYILILVFLNRKLKDTTFCTEWFTDFSLLLISWCTDFWCVSIVPKYLEYATTSKDLLLIFMLWFCPEGCSWHDHHMYSFLSIY